MPSYCFVPFCDSGKKNCLEKRSLFCPPKDEETLRIWKRAIPRSDKELSHKDRVCQVHFEEDDIIKGLKITVGGKEDLFPMKWRLKPAAIPRIFPGCPKYLNNPSRRRKSHNSSVPPKLLPRTKRKVKSEDELAIEVVERPDSSRVSEPPVNQNVVNNTINTKQTMGDPRNAKLPPSWSWHTIPNIDPLCDRLMCIQNLVICEEIVVFKAIEIRKTENSVVFYVFGKRVDSVELEYRFQSLSDLEDILNNFHQAKVCGGCTDPAVLQIESCTSGYRHSGMWRSKECPIILIPRNSPCFQCQKLAKMLHQQLKCTKNEVLDAIETTSTVIPDLLEINSKLSHPTSTESVKIIVTKFI